ncbi:MAG TPA: hypothetical protein VII31_03695 [Caldimonas sp.]|jgi:hypothetical protein
MFFTIFCCISTALLVFCVLNRINKRTVELAVHAAVHEAKKEFLAQSSSSTNQMAAQVAAKERELTKARELVKLHEAVPSTMPAAKSSSAKGKDKKAPREGLEVFAMSRPFTDTSYDALLATSDVVKVEPASM